MIAAIVAETSEVETRRALARLDDDPRVGLVELRGDAFAVSPSLLAACRKPTLATFRRPKDGGLRSLDESLRRQWLEAAASFATWVDVECDVLESWRPSGPARLLASVHDFESVPEFLEQLVAAVRPRVAAVKVAVKPADLRDLTRLVHLARSGPTVVVGLDAVGIPLRWLPDRVGSLWTYARTEGSAVTAPGLSALDALCAPSGPNPVAPPDLVLGVLSDRALDSVGPSVFHRVFRDLGVRGVYVPLTSPSLQGLREFWKSLDFAGLSVTTPFKESVRAFADREDPLVARVGAANTLVRRGGEILAANTDVAGVREAVAAVARGAHSSLVVGTGGAGRAAILALEQLGLRPRAASRSADHAAVTARELGVPSGWPSEPPDILVNATPAGSARDPDALPVPDALLAPGQVVLEMNYHATETPLSRRVRALGGRVIPGRLMYFHQAGEQLKWFGLEAGMAALRSAVSAELGAI